MKTKIHRQVATRVAITVGWCIILAFLHFAITCVISGIYLSAGMGISTRDAHDFHFPFALWKGFLWIWSPLAMAARSPHHTPNEDMILGLAILWSCVIGIAAGFASSALRRRVFSALSGSTIE